MQRKVLYQGIFEAIKQIKIIDSHCHIALIDKVKDGMDLFKLFSMFTGSTLLSLGMSEADLAQLSNSTMDLSAKWNLFQPYWEKSFNTAYSRQFLKAAADLYGISVLNKETYRKLSSRITEAYNDVDAHWYRTVLKEKAGIERGILDNGTTRVNPGYFFPTYRFESRRVPEYDRFITVRTREDLEKIEEHYQRNIVRFDDFLKLFEEVFTARVKEGMVAVKLLLAVFRPLNFPQITMNEAEKAFNSILLRFKPNGSQQYQNEGPAWEEVKLIQDFMVHQTLYHALSHHLTVQIHGGFQLGKRNTLANSDPKLLNNLFIQYPNLNFVVLHSAMPFSYDLAFMAKNFSNLYMDFSWTNTLAPSITKRLFSEVLELLPVNKIIGFGCDNSTVEAAYSEAVTIRQMLASVLTEKVESGYFTENEAIQVGERILRQNAIDLYKLAV